MFRRLPQPVALAGLALLLEVAFLALRRLHPLDARVVEVIAVSLAASVVYFVAAYRVFSWRQSTPAALAVVLLAAVVFRATLFPLPPTLSNDFYRYVWEGQIQRAAHNPYLSVPADPALAPPPAELTRLPGQKVPAAYPPLTQLFFRLAAHFDGQIAFKLLSVAFDLGTLLLLVGLLLSRAEPPVRALLYGWCPLVVLEFAGSGHNDSLAVFALVLANLWIIRRRGALSIVALAAATLSKYFAAVALPVFLRRTRWWGLPLFTATAAVLSLPYAGAGWNLLRGFMTYAEKWRNNESLYALLLAASGEQTVATGVALGVVAGMALYLALEPGGPLPAPAGADRPPRALRASYLLLAAVLLLSPTVFPWYVTWLVPFLCFFPHPGFLLFTATVLLSYHALLDYSAFGVWRYTSWLVWLEYLPVYALLLWKWWRARTPGLAYR